MKKGTIIVLKLFLIVSFFGAFACGESKIVPEDKHESVPRAWTEEQVDGLVSMNQVSIYSPAPANPESEILPPDECNYIRFNRFKLKSMPESASKADAVLIMIPGVVEGANGFEYIGRQLVYIAKTQYGKAFEVWAFDRRNNCLEDVTGTKAAEQETDLAKAEQICINYYYKGGSINGKTFKGFLTSSDVPFLSEFGFKMDTEDIYKIMTAMIPDRETRKNKIFVGGHSLGGIHTSIFAGWDFDGNKMTADDAGYMNCAGMFAFDSSLIPVTSYSNEIFTSLFADPTTKQLINDLLTGIKLPEEMIELFRSGSIPLTIPFIDGEVGMLMETIGYFAYAEPDQENTAIKNVPYSDTVKLLNRFFSSRNLERFLTGEDDLQNYRFTNEALLGVLFDDNFAPLGMIQTSLGFLSGGEVVAKEFPVSEGMEESSPDLYTMIAGFTGSGPFYIPTESRDSGPLYTWANFDQIGTADDPYYQSSDGSITYTSIYTELSDIHDFARAQFKGNSNLIEWYFSTRRIADILLAAMPMGPDYGINFMYPDQVSYLPQIEFHAGDSFLASSGLLSDKYTPLAGENHMDPMFVAADRPDYQENKIIKPLIEFVLTNSR